MEGVGAKIRGFVSREKKIGLTWWPFLLLVKRGRGEEETELVLLKGIHYTHVLTQKDTKKEASALWSLIFLWESVAHVHKKVSPSSSIALRGARSIVVYA